MLNKVCNFIRQQDFIHPGDQVVCALSGGADSVALFWALYLLRDKLKISLSAAHFNHGLRGEESDRDQAFVESLCRDYGILLHIGSAKVQPGQKGLEAAARDARYGFFATLPGKIATAHTADDNAETVLMHLVRGTGLKGLGGISPSRGNIIRPMLTVTRQEVLAFLQEYSLPHVEDSSNETDAFLRNRIRHGVMPLLQQENPSLSRNLSRMALRLRREEQLLESLTEGPLPEVSELRGMEPALRSRYLTKFLEECGVREPEAEHVALAEELVFSEKPSAKASFPNEVTVCRRYDRLVKAEPTGEWIPRQLSCPGTVELPELGVRICCVPAEQECLKWDRFTVYPCGEITVRSRKTGDKLRLQGGTKSLKELMVDKKIPAQNRSRIPVLADGNGVLAVWGIGANLDRISGEGTPVEIRFEEI